MRKLLTLLVGIAVSMSAVAANGEASEANQQAVQNVTRAMNMLDVAIDKCFTGSGMSMYDMINVNTLNGSGVADVWPYTAAMEAVNSVLEALTMLKDTNPDLYAANYDRYVTLLANLYSNLEYYKGHLNSLTSYTRTQSWNVYGVHRSSTKGGAAVAGIENVYDDQEWLIRELLRAYRLTGTNAYLSEAEALTEYVLDGWDCCIDADGNEYGGITWGPGYTSKHSCSNGPIISPLVWLHEIYANSVTTARHYTINADGTRVVKREKKGDYYLEFAKKVYAWQKANLMDGTTYTYLDAAWATTGDILQETVNGVTYRKHLDIDHKGGTVFTYNTGAMLSGVVDLYRVTGDESYLSDMKQYMSKGYSVFTSNRRIDGVRYREYPYEDAGSENVGKWGGFNVWFADVLLRGLIEGYQYNKVVTGINVFQNNLDYAYEKHLKNGILPQDLLGGWDTHTEIRSMFPLTYASEYAMLAKHLLIKEELASGIVNFKTEVSDENLPVDVYDVDGRRVRANVSRRSSLEGLHSGVYIVDGRKYIVR